jgi:hypothetical protein
MRSIPPCTGKKEEKRQDTTPSGEGKDEHGKLHNKIPLMYRWFLYFFISIATLT